MHARTADDDGYALPYKCSTIATVDTNEMGIQMNERKNGVNANCNFAFRVRFAFEYYKSHASFFLSDI